MDPTSDATGRRIVKLLTVLVALTGVLLVAFVVGGLVAWRQYRDVREAVVRASATEGIAPDQVSSEIAARQRYAAEQLEAMSADASRQIAQFEQRAAKLRRAEGGPIDTAAKAVGILELTLDGSILALKQTAALQRVLARGSGPLGESRSDDRGADATEAGRSREDVPRARHPERRAERRAPAR